MLNVFNDAAEEELATVFTDPRRGMIGVKPNLGREHSGPN
jgi:hypothetical protein